MEEFRWEFLPHAPYSSDIATLVYHLFRSMQNSLVGKEFADEEEKFLEDNAINYICDWSAQSSDLNVIENMWSYVKQKLYLTEFNNINELWMNFKKEFFEVPNDYIRNLYASFKTRINAVLAANGGITKY